MTTQKSGWGWPQLARKAHYFVDGMSLCRHWMFTGSTYERADDNEDNCATCMRIRLNKKPEVNQ